MAQDQEVVNFLILRVAGRDCALALESVAEVVPLPELLRAPAMPSLLEGFLNLAGTIYPVLRLDRALGLPESSLEIYTPIIVLKNLGRPLALLADAAVRVVHLPRGQVHPLPAPENAGPVTAEFRWRDSPVALLDGPRILALAGEAALRDYEAMRAGNLGKWRTGQ